MHTDPDPRPDLPPLDVAVVGLGPVGAALALRLDALGVRVAVLERDVTPHALPRAAHLDDEALAVLRRAGVLPEVLAAGRAIDGFELADRHGRTLLRARKRPVVDGLPTALLVHQPTVERALRARLAARGVPVHLGTTVTDVRDLGDGVEVDATERGGAPLLAQAAFVVGCDGARSTVRDAMRTRLHGGGFRQRWLVVDTLVPDVLAEALPDRLVQTADPRRARTFVPFPGARRRWEWRLRPEETDGEAEATAFVRARLAEALAAAGLGPDLEGVEIERATVYTFYDLVAERWRRGRLLLAGDAAHLMPPFLGQGLGAGLRDADALAPRLAAVLDGAPPDLLDDYETERRRHVRATTRLAVALGRLITLPEPLATARDLTLRAGQRVPGLRDRLLGWTVRLPAAPPARAGSWTGELAEKVARRGR